MLKKAKKPTTSVTVVTNAPDAKAGSIPNFSRNQSKTGVKSKMQFGENFGENPKPMFNLPESKHLPLNFAKN